jgi:hypothetical protein
MNSRSEGGREAPTGGTPPRCHEQRCTSVSRWALELRFPHNRQSDGISAESVWSSAAVERGDDWTNGTVGSDVKLFQYQAVFTVTYKHHLHMDK